MKTIDTYKDESAVDLCIRAYGHIEALIPFCKENGFSVDYEDLAGNNSCVINEVLKTELSSSKPLFSKKPIVKQSVSIVNAEQNLIDLVLQESGSIEGFISFLRLNNLTPNSFPAAGLQLRVNELDVVNTDVRDYLRSISHKVCSGVFDIDASGVPANVLLNEDGTPLLAEDGSYLLAES